MDIWEKLYAQAKDEYHPQDVTPFVHAHHVVCALESEDGRIYTGFCIESCSGVMNLCAERVAALNMYLSSGQTKIKRLIAFRDKAPCGGGTYGNLSVTDGKTITDHLMQDTFCIQKDDADNNDKNLYWYEIAAVQSMNNAVVHPISFKTEPIADVEAKAGGEINVPINFHETPYYEESAYIIEDFILINEDGSETKLDYGERNDNFTELDTTTKPWKSYPVKDKTTTATLKYSMFPGTGAYKVYAVLAAYLSKKKVDYPGGTYNLLVEKYVTKTEPFEIRIGVSRPMCVMPEDAVDADGNVGIGWNIYSLYTYTGAPQQLVHSTPQVLGGTMMYRFNENDEWTAEVPTATEPGVYTYQCYIKGDDGYMDVPMRDGRAVINSARIIPAVCLKTTSILFSLRTLWMKR